jgi:hypothetical protein
MEYAGYIKRKPTDWSKIARETTERLGAIEEGREKKREELDTLYQDTKKAIREVELGQNETTNQAVLKGAQEARDEIYSDYKALRAGDLSPREFRSLNNNRQDSWGELNTAMKQYNARVSEVNKMEDDGTASESMLYDNAQIALRMGNDGYEWKWSDDGTLVSAQIDANGKIVPNTILPVSSLNKTQNVLSKRFDLKKAVGLDKIGKFKKVVGDMMVKGYNVIPEVDKFNATVTKSILTSDDIIGKVLTDASTDPYFYYTTDKELADKIAAGGKKEFGVKKELGRDGGMVAVPSPTQKTAAEKVITDWVKYEIGVEETPLTKDKTYKPSGKEEGEMAGYMLSNQWAQGQNIDKIKSLKSPQGDKVINVENLKNTIRISTVDSKGNRKYHNLTKGKPEEFMPWAYKSSMGPAGQEGSYMRGEGFYKQKHGKPFSITASTPQEIKPYSLGNYDAEEQDKKNKQYKKILSMDSDNTANEATIKSDVKSILSTTLASVGVEDFNDNDINIEWIEGGNWSDDKIKVSIKGGKVVKEIELDRVSPGDKWANDMNTTIEAIVNDYITHYNETLKAGGTTKKSVSQLTKENPNLTKAEIIKLYKNQ